MLAIIVPYRDREDHLAQFIPHMNKYLPHAQIFIVEQADDKPFNRGKLLNIGTLEIRFEYYMYHDVDMLPIRGPYHLPDENEVRQIAKSEIQPINYLGGVTIFKKQTIELAGGYHNDYFHRAEDNEMMFHLKRLQVPIISTPVVFHQLPHPRTGPEFIPELWQKAQLPRTKNMLATCEYEVISKEEFGTHTHIKVML